MRDSQENRCYDNELLNQAFIYLPAALVSSTVISLILVGVLWPVTGHVSLTLWMCSVWVISILRFALLYYYRHQDLRDRALRNWTQWFTVGVVLSGLSWGVVGPLFFSRELPQYNVFIAFCLGGITAGAANSLAPLPRAMGLFTALQLSPIVVRLLSSQEEIHIAMGVLLILFGGACLVISSQVHKTLLSSLQLRRQNLAEIAERERAENELRRHKGELEKLVQERTEQLQVTNEELSEEIAERRIAEERLRVSEERFRDLVETSSDWIWEVDPEGAYTYASPKVEALLGYTPDEVLRKTPFDLMANGEEQKVREQFQEIARSGAPFSGVEKKNRHKDGRVVILESSGEPIKDAAGKLLGYRGVDRDITERKRIESEAQRIRNLESIGLLAGGIAHDFNNLLSAIFGNIDLARYHTSTDSEPYRLLSNAANAIDKAKRLTAQLLTFSRGGAPIKKTFAMSDLIIDTAHFVLSGSSIKCHYNLADDLSEIDGDEGQIWQVLQNLLLNASDAMPRGGTIKIAARNYAADQESEIPEKSGTYIKITVEDNGCGIEEGILPKVFDPYFSTKPKSAERGTGLGLATCHSIIKKHDGHIFLDSQPGKGTKVSFFLPASNKRKDRVRAEKKPSKPAPRERGRVLLLEDEDIVRNITVRMVNHLGYDCDSATDGERAIELYTQAQSDGTPFDLVILDLTVRGGMGGGDTMRRLLEIDPKVVGVVASGYADSEIIANYRRYGFQAAIVKPYNMNALRNVIMQFV